MNDEHDHRPPDGADDADLESLLRAAGPRATPPPDVTAQVRAAVAAEWRATVAARQPRPMPRRKVVPWLAAASVAAVAVGAWLTVPRLMQGPVEVASVARLDGVVEIRSDASGRWAPLAAASMVRVGDAVRTSGGGRVALRRADGLELRLDAATTLAFDAGEAARLDAGRLYVDAGPSGSNSRSFEVETALGSVRHLGTQYSVAVTRGALEVAVREGSVAVDAGREPIVARAGERLDIQGDGRVVRSGVEAQGAAWSWAQAVAPAYAIEGRTLDEFLGWAARESGHQLVYGSADVARVAEATVLKGSVDGLAPEDAVAAVLMTTPTLQHHFAGAQLRIERARR